MTFGDLVGVWKLPKVSLLAWNPICCIQPFMGAKIYQSLGILSFICYIIGRFILVGFIYLKERYCIWCLFSYSYTSSTLFLLMFALVLYQYMSQAPSFVC